MTRYIPTPLYFSPWAGVDAEPERRLDGASGFLGTNFKSYQKTFKCRAEEVPWSSISFVADPFATIEISHDGKNYGQRITIIRGRQSFDIAARAVRIKVRRSQEHVFYSIVCSTGRENAQN